MLSWSVFDLVLSVLQILHLEATFSFLIFRFDGNSVHLKYETVFFVAYVHMLNGLQAFAPSVWRGTTVCCSRLE